MSRILVIIAFLLLLPNIIFAKNLDNPPITYAIPEINKDCLKTYYLPNFPKSLYDLIPNQPSTTYYQFEGLYGVAAKEAKNQLRSYYIRNLKSTYGKDYLYHIHIDEEPWPSWQNRNWWEYLPLNKGGLPASRIIQVGNTHKVFSIGPFSLYNNLRVKFRTEGFQADGRIQDQTQYRDPDINPRFKIEETLAIDASNFKPKIQPSVSFKLLSSNPLEIIRQVSLKIEIGIYNDNGRHIANLTSAVRYSPSDNDLNGYIGFDLVNF